MACATIIDNAVASSSCVTLDPPLAPLLERIVMPTLAEQAEFDACQKAKRKTRWGNEKAKKDLVHLAPLNPSLKGKNIIIFTDAKIPDEVSNPIDVESGETLFTPNPQGNYDHEDVKVNPRHPRARFYQLLMDSYAQDQSGEHFKRTIINPLLYLLQY